MPGRARDVVVSGEIFRRSTLQKLDELLPFDGYDLLFQNDR